MKEVKAYMIDLIMDHKLPNEAFNNTDYINAVTNTFYNYRETMPIFNSLKKAFDSIDYILFI
jgi:hypothetical protein